MRTPYRLAAAAFIPALLVAGCASFAPSSVPVGASMAEVESKTGKPPSVVKAPGGDVVWQFPTGPAGQTTYMVEFGPDQRVRSVYQALTEERFAKIVPGQTTREDIRLLLGPPGETTRFSRMNEEVWSYRYQAGWSTNRIFNVHFDSTTGRVRSTGDQEDPLFLPPIRVIGLASGGIR
jgi:hypothetical protein